MDSRIMFRWALAAGAGIAVGAALLVRRSVEARADAERIFTHRAEMDTRRDIYKDTFGASLTTVLPNAAGLKLFVRTWKPKPGPPSRGLVVMIHGVTVHGGCFAGIAKHLAAQGLAVVSYDHQGYGLSDCFEGLRGYVRRFRDWVDDCDTVLDWAQKQFPGTPTFLLGESMGGTVALKALLRQEVREKVRGVVLMAPGVRMAPAVLPPKAMMPFLMAAAHIFPRSEVPDDSVTNPVIWKAMFGDAVYAEAAYRNPLFCVDRPRLHMLLLLPEVEELWRHLEEVITPFLVVHSPEDTRAEIAASEALLARAGAQDKELMPVPGGAHMLFLDKPDISARVTEHVTNWLMHRC